MQKQMLTSFVVVGLLGSSLFADDWPQWRGPNRDGVSLEKGLLQAWPKDGPALKWTFENAGLGFSSPSIVGNRLYCMGARNEKTYLYCLDISASEPKELWSVEVGPIFTFKGNVWGDGPRSTPTVDGDRVYGLSGSGHLICVSTDGKPLWRRHLVKDFHGVMMSEWGYSESVLIDGDKLVCMAGGDDGTVVALNKKNGELIWRTKELKDKATYSSIVKATLAGVPQYVVLTYVDGVKGGSAAGVDSTNGKLLWYFPGICGDSYAVAPTPLVRGDQVYITSGYGGGCRLLQISKSGDKLVAKNLYRRRETKVMKNTHGGVVRVGDYVYGHSERSGWVCQDWKTGREMWYDKERRLQCTSGSIIAAGDRLYLFSDRGTAVLLEANPKGWKEHGRFEIPKKSKTPRTRPTSQYARIWTHPVIANGCLYLRDQEYLFCFDIRGK